MNVKNHFLTINEKIIVIEKAYILTSNELINYKCRKIPCDISLNCHYLPVKRGSNKMQNRDQVGIKTPSSGKLMSS